MSIGKLSIGALYIHWDTIYNGSYMYFLGHIKGKSIETISAGTQYLIIPTVLGHYLLRTLHAYLLRKYALRRPQLERTKTSRPSKSGRQTNQKAAAWRYIY